MFLCSCVSVFVCVVITLTSVSLLYPDTPVVCVTPVTDTNNFLQQIRQFKKVPQLQRLITWHIQKVHAMF